MKEKYIPELIMAVVSNEQLIDVQCEYGADFEDIKAIPLSDLRRILNDIFSNE